MTQTTSYQQMGTADRGQAHALFAQTMGYVAITAGLFALGAWAGHNLTGGALWQAGISFWALVAPIVVGLVLTFVTIPGADLAYSVLGLVIFAGFVMFDFQRLRTNTDQAVAPLLAASIFLDVR